MTYIRFRFIHTLVLLILALLLQSCATHNLFETTRKTEIGVDSTLLAAQPTPYQLRRDDKISVSIWGHDDLSIGSLFGIYNSNEVYGKWVLVDQQGYVQLPKIGKVCMEGLTTDEAAERLTNIYSEFIIDPIVVVKVLNKEVTILGEVMTPGTYLLEKEENFLFEMMGRAGGLDFYADKKKVKFIRNNTQYILDLTKMDEFTLNNLVLYPGDLIYVPTRKGKTLDKKAPTLIPFTSAATTIAILFTLFAK